MSSTETRSVQERLLDAAEGCLRRAGIRRTTMIDSADRAAVACAGLDQDPTGA